MAPLSTRDTFSEHTCNDVLPIVTDRNVEERPNGCLTRELGLGPCLLVKRPVCEVLPRRSERVKSFVRCLFHRPPMDLVQLGFDGRDELAPHAQKLRCHHFIHCSHATVVLFVKRACERTKRVQFHRTEDARCEIECTTPSNEGNDARDMENVDAYSMSAHGVRVRQQIVYTRTSQPLQISFTPILTRLPRRNLLCPDHWAAITTVISGARYRCSGLTSLGSSSSPYCIVKSI